LRPSKALAKRARSSSSPEGGLGWPLLGASLFATNIGAEHLVGLSGDAYRYGLRAGTVELTTYICLGIACAVLFPNYLRLKIYTIPERTAPLLSVPGTLMRRIQRAIKYFSDPDSGKWCFGLLSSTSNCKSRVGLTGRCTAGCARSLRIGSILQHS
jgi:hypothetical protein